jgi:hypothetical protein
MFHVMCQVSGGVTGTRRSLLKKMGDIVEFETREEAQAEADRLQSTMGKNSPATFRYWVTEEGF